MLKAKTILFFVSHDWYFRSHRLALARGCVARGMHVVVVTQPGDDTAFLEAEGFKVCPIVFKRGSMNLFSELGVLRAMRAIIKTEQPDIVHLIALKFSTYGAIIGLFDRQRIYVATIAGMGFLFTTAASVFARLASIMVRTALKAGFSLAGGRRWITVQNRDDKKLVCDLLGSSETVVLIPGSGVDLEHFSPRKREPGGTPVVVCVSRMLKDKGIREMVAAARLLKERGVEVRIQLVGPSDAENPTNITDATLTAWHDEGCIEWLGPRDDIANLLSQAHIAALPSYREGMPKSLLEAAAAGLPIVTTDVPGCRDVIEAGTSGLLVPKADAVALADALQRLITYPNERRAMGAAARARAEALFSQEAIAAQTIAVYERAMEAALPI